MTDNPLTCGRVAATFAPEDYRAAPPPEPDGAYVPPGEGAAKTTPKFELEPWETIKRDAGGEWLIKKRVPKSGVGILFGESQSFKTFVAFDLALHVATGKEWNNCRVAQAPVVYIAAEGAAGLKKRKEGFELSHSDLPAKVPFFLIAAAPNLGMGADDQIAMGSAIEAANVTPGLVILDTLSKCLGPGDENGGGMMQLLANAEAIARRFKCLVLALHHVGLGDGERERGHSSTSGGTDLRILCQRKEREMSTVLTWRKLKDEDCEITLRANLSRVVIDLDEDGDEISTLVVDSVEEEEPKASKPRATSVPRQQRLFMETLAQAIDEAGEKLQPFPNGPTVKAASEDTVRGRYYERIAEEPFDGDTPEKIAERQKKAFNRAVKANLDAKRIVAGEKNGSRFLWLP